MISVVVGYEMTSLSDLRERNDFALSSTILACWRNTQVIHFMITVS